MLKSLVEIYECCGEQLDFLQGENGIKISVKKEKVAENFRNFIQLLEYGGINYIPLKVEQQEECYLFNYEIKRELRNFATARSLSEVDKLRLCLNFLHADFAKPNRLIPFIFPENIFFDDNLCPLLMHRGLKGEMSPYALDGQKHFHEVKALMLSIFLSNYTFKELSCGAMQLLGGGSVFIKDVNTCKTHEKLVETITLKYEYMRSYTLEETQIVSKKKYLFLKRTHLMMAVLVGMLLCICSYFILIKSPMQKRLLLSHATYLEADYHETITILAQEKVEKLPQASKYVLAISAIQGENLTRQQRSAILNNISLKSDPQYLLFWIYSGKGQVDEMLDSALQLQDLQLELFALEKKRIAVYENTTLSGGEKEEQLQKLSTDIEARTTAFEQILVAGENIGEKI
ncbi:type VII secretion protein EssB [Erysipelotrichaceae bacterium]|nr:type VII secretion protein EssB [Erysipelotrichaceae bacterium]